MDYLSDVNIDEISTFSLKIWVENSSNIQRTTNALESFHVRFNKSFYIALYSFILLDIKKQIQLNINISKNSCSILKNITKSSFI